jgi:tRNA (guanine-N7-)-methyltransferase
MKQTLVSLSQDELDLAHLAAPLQLEELLPGDGPWEVEIGFGKGRFLLQRATVEPEGRFLGIEVARKYYRLARKRMRKQALTNVILIGGEALYLLSVALPAAFASVLHVYFPDPWPKSRHQKRRLFDPDSVDLVIGLLQPGGRLYFATDHLEYGDLVAEILGSHPAVTVKSRQGLWEDGPRTNYEAKYENEKRPILRLEAIRSDEAGVDLIHPRAGASLLAAARLSSS